MQIYRRGSRELFDLPEDLFGEDRVTEHAELNESARIWLAAELTREPELPGQLWREAAPALALDSQLLALCSRVRKKHYSFLVAEFIQCEGIEALNRLTQQCPLPLLAEIQQRTKIPGQKALATLVRSHIKANASAAPSPVKADEFGLARMEPVSNLEFVVRVIVSSEYVFPVAAVGNLHERAWPVLFELGSGLYNHFALGRHASMVQGLLQTVTVSGFRANRVPVPPPGRKGAAPASDGPTMLGLPVVTDIRESLQLLSTAQKQAPPVQGTSTPSNEGSSAQTDAHTPLPPVRTAEEERGFRHALSALWGRVKGRSASPAPAPEQPAEQQPEMTRSEL